MATLTIDEPRDYRGEVLTNINRLAFDDSGEIFGMVARFNATQFGSGLIELNSTLAILPSFVGGRSFLAIHVASGASFSAANFVLDPTWSSSDQIQLIGNSGNQGLVGSKGTDRFTPGSGTDTVDGRGGDDVIVLSAGSQISSGDLFDGGTHISRDTIALQGSNQTFNFAATSILNIERIAPDSQDVALTTATVSVAPSQLGAGKITIIGGGTSGDVIAFATAGSAVNLSAITFENWGAEESITLSGTSFTQNALTGSDKADKILGTSLAVNILRGGGGNDTLVGGDKSDTFVYLNENALAGESVNGLGGTDTIRTFGQVSLDGATISGVERLLITSDPDFGGTGVGAVFMNAADLGAGHITTIDGTTTDDPIQLQIKGDNYDLSGVTFVNFDLPNRTVSHSGSPGDETIIGSSVNDIFFSSTGINHHEGRAGDDAFIIDSPTHLTDTYEIIGGQGTDNVNAGDGAQSTVFDFRSTAVSEVERAVLGGNDNTYVFSAAQVDQDAISTFEGTAFGADRLVVEGSDVNLLGVTFIDWDRVTIKGSNLGDQLLGSQFGELLQGLESADLLSGAGGKDTLEGGDGNDTLTGGSGGDLLRGGAGNDLYTDPVVTGVDADTIEEDVGGGDADLVLSSVTFSLAGIANVERLTLTGLGPANGTGNELDNVIFGNGSGNVLSGSEGNDTLTGSAGNDRLIGGVGADRLIGGTEDDTYVNPVLTGVGADTIEEAIDAGIDTVLSNASLSIANVANVERVELTGAGDINATGNDSANFIAGTAGRNTLVGGNGADTLNGGGGKDILVGGKNNDVMAGGGDADTFRFLAAANSSGNDTIQGFETALDRFDLSGGAFSALSESAAGTRLTHAGGTILIQGVTGLTLDGWNALVVPPPSGRAFGPEGQFAMTDDWLSGA